MKENASSTLTRPGLARPTTPDLLGNPLSITHQKHCSQSLQGSRWLWPWITAETSTYLWCRQTAIQTPSVSSCLTWLKSWTEIGLTGNGTRWCSLMGLAITQPHRSKHCSRNRKWPPSSPAHIHLMEPLPSCSLRPSSVGTWMCRSSRPARVSICLFWFFRRIFFKCSEDCHAEGQGNQEVTPHHDVAPDCAETIFLSRPEANLRITIYIFQSRPWSQYISEAPGHKWNHFCVKAMNGNTFHLSRPWMWISFGSRPWQFAWALLPTA